MTTDIRRARRSAGLHILGASVAIALGGCAAEIAQPIDEVAAYDDEREASESVERIDAETFAGLTEDVEVLLDLRDEQRGYAVDTSSAPVDRLALICPNGQVMSWSEWLATDLEIALRLDGVIGIAATHEQAARAASEPQEPCPLDCYECADGATICRPDPSCAGDSTTADEASAVHGELWREHGGYQPVGDDPSPGGEGGGDDPDPTSPSEGGSGSYSGSGSSGSGGSGGYSSSPGGHPGWS